MLALHLQATDGSVGLRSLFEQGSDSGSDDDDAADAAAVLACLRPIGALILSAVAVSRMIMVLRSILM